jgi:hypothetical protein
MPRSSLSSPSPSFRGIYGPPPPGRSDSRRVGVACIVLLSAGLNACGSSETEPVFAGQGATVEARQTPIEQAPAEVDAGPCAQAAPPSDVTLIEDFEDANNQLFKAFRREGWWYVATDDTPGSILPEKGEFNSIALPPEEATLENRYALYGKAQGYQDWGVVWGTTIRWKADGLKCPFNASNYVGLKFRARGKGSLHLKIGNPETVPAEYEGKCTQKCWDSHGQRVYLTEDWRAYVVRWDRVQQEGWGAEARFDPERLLAFNFSVNGKDLPVEFWLDDIEFIREGYAAPAPSPPASAPGATGAVASPPATLSTSAPVGPASAPSEKSP